MKEYFISVACMHTGESYGVVILRSRDEYEAYRRAVAMSLTSYEFDVGTHPPERMNRVVGKEEALSWGCRSLRDEANRSMN